ncbi:unnamed protein product (macronuclear) [Paramecium tetraurelia]|uniref:Uncharacterized protein n=1 Tax=Paramecium tetraurelia TaxID=5888 RepID=A0EGC6_PARTE|nr:uncharacterized protein GSPATT00026691001 [Paramecium tetraurelia]CAK94367.1 unnamed protein product [Paramecium tetraurelia]|eukprot:XP_001461740.1 hypothetical protein (macronuclear) [Paramecium tetraurelia strain d4-2]
MHSSKAQNKKSMSIGECSYFGIAGLLSMSTIQSSVFSAILAWLTFVPLAVLHLCIYDKFQNLNNHKDTLWLAYYGLQFVWFLGIIIDFYS